MHVASLIIAGLNLLAILFLCWILMPAREEEAEVHAVGFRYTPPQEEDDDLGC